MTPRSIVFRSLGAALAVALTAAAVAAQHAGHQEQAPGAPTKAVAVLAPTAGNTVHGVVTFMAVDGGVRITAQVEGLPAGGHGFHIHEYEERHRTTGRTRR